ncbi:MAG TPA: carbohydrate kinase family protein [Candidatus Binatia bacterium]|nr:carbohydrate kinase family protein [Candidatus Binatia bacterium]
MYDIVTIGSATVDVFVNVSQNGREFVNAHHHPDVCLPLGAKVLIDDLVMDTGGGGTNTAVSFARLGFKTGYAGAVADDQNGKHILDILRKEKVTFLGKSKKGKSGYSVILMHLKGDRTILAYKGVNDTLQTRDVKPIAATWLYCSSMLGQSGETLVKLIEAAKKKGTRVAFNPSLYLAQLGLRKLTPILKHTDVLVLNKEEAEALLGMNAPIKTLLTKLSEHIPVPVITDGPHGAYATDGGTLFAIHPHHVPVVETTGAGDAFASGFVAGQLLGKDLPTSLRMGQAQAEGVLSAVGAKNKLFTRPQLLAEMRKRPHEVTGSAL